MRDPRQVDNAVRYGGIAGPIEVIVDSSSEEVVVRIVDRGDAPPPGSHPFDLTRSGVVPV